MNLINGRPVRNRRTGANRSIHWFGSQKNVVVVATFRTFKSILKRCQPIGWYMSRDGVHLNIWGFFPLITCVHTVKVHRRYLVFVIWSSANWNVSIEPLSPSSSLGFRNTSILEGKWMKYAEWMTWNEWNQSCVQRTKSNPDFRLLEHSLMSPRFHVDTLPMWNSRASSE